LLGEGQVGVSLAVFRLSSHRTTDPSRERKFQGASVARSTIARRAAAIAAAHPRPGSTLTPATRERSLRFCRGSAASTGTRPLRTAAPLELGYLSRSAPVAELTLQRRALLAGTLLDSVGALGGGLGALQPPDVGAQRLVDRVVLVRRG
jgi:hypothetical protein